MSLDHAPGAPGRRLPVLLWDIDGTLIDTTHLVTGGLDHVYRTFLGKTLPPDELRALVGIPLTRQVHALGDPAQYGATVEQMEAEFIRWWEQRKHDERVIPQAIEALIAGRRAGHPTGLVTSKNLEEIGNTLPRVGVADWVDVIVSADDVARPKPDPEGIQLALRRLDAQPSDALYIGDTVHDMRAGRDAGVRRCAVTWGAAPRAALEAEAPELLCDDPDELAVTIGLQGRLADVR